MPVSAINPNAQRIHGTHKLSSERLIFLREIRRNRIFLEHRIECKRYFKAIEIEPIVGAAVAVSSLILQMQRDVLAELVLGVLEHHP